MLDRVLASLMVAWLYVRFYGALIGAGAVLLFVYCLIARIVGAAL